MKDYTISVAYKFIVGKPRPKRRCKVVNGRLHQGTKSGHKSKHGVKFNRLIRLNKGWFRPSFNGWMV
jgi:hypothetical protein